jgi:hypothetical protein
MTAPNIIGQILDLARWAPSGDNSQPWRFEVVDERHFIIHGFDTRTECIYDLDGRPSQISLGALIETASIAASAHGLSLQVERRRSLPDTRPTFDVALVPLDQPAPSPLLAAIEQRRVQRRRLETRPLTEAELRGLEAAVGPDHTVLWFSGWQQRLRWANLLWDNAGLRLRLPEAFEVHRRVIQWHAQFSPDRIPDHALGVDALTLAMMRQAMSSWERLDFLNTWLGGTLAPRLMMDWLPALACAAHVAIVARQPPMSIDDYVAGGRAVQRFWLTATCLGLQHQPAITPLVFARYRREGRRFTARQSLWPLAQGLGDRLNEILAGSAPSAIWLGRIGHGPAASARSVRLSLQELQAPPQTPPR